ncbi:MAG TPA: ferritin [Myxococcaceae bacterium]|nr:ferritin [Myxococcaceae bacterium]
MAGPSDSELLNDVARIRRVLARELETINEYEAFAQLSSSPEVRAFFAHLAAEEKEHVAEATQMLRMLDAAQDSHFQQPIAPGHFQKAVGAQKAPGAPASPAAPSSAPAHGPGSQNVGRPGPEPISLLPPNRVMYGLTAPPSKDAYPLTVGSLRRQGGGTGGRGGTR